MYSHNYSHNDKTVIGSYSDREELSREINRLVDEGYTKDEITLFGNSETVKAFGTTDGVNVEQAPKTDRVMEDDSIWSRIKDAFTVDATEENYSDDPNYDETEDVLGPYRSDIDNGNVVLTVRNYRGVDTGMNTDADTAVPGAGMTDPQTPTRDAGDVDTSARTIDHEGVPDALDEDTDPAAIGGYSDPDRMDNPRESTDVRDTREARAPLTNVEDDMTTRGLGLNDPTLRTRGREPHDPNDPLYSDRLSETRDGEDDGMADASYAYADVDEQNAAGYKDDNDRDDEFRENRNEGVVDNNMTHRNDDKLNERDEDVTTGRKKNPASDLDTSARTIDHEGVPEALDGDDRPDAIDGYADPNRYGENENRTNVRDGRFEAEGYDDEGNTRVNNRNDENLTDEERIRLREERLEVDKDNVKKGEVDIHKRTVEETKTVDVPVEHEEVIIERRSVDEGDPVSDGLDNDDDSIRIPVHEEQVEVTKKPVVYEEVEVRKQRKTNTEHISEDVTREELDVDTEGDIHVEDGEDRR